MKFNFLAFLFLVTFVTDASGQSSLTTLKNWPGALAQARGKTVTFAAWSGSDLTNQYIDHYLAPQLKQRFGITLNRFPLSETGHFVAQLIRNKKKRKTDSNVDLIWINGENFYLLQKNDLLWGPYLPLLPNSKLLRLRSKSISHDFGQPHHGFESPWGSAQFVFIYDSRHIESPPRSFRQLVSWIKENPGRFTYPSPPDFTGSAFVRQIIHNENAGYALLKKDSFPLKARAAIEKILKELNSTEPFLWRKGKTYPPNIARAHQLFSDGEIWITMDYHPLKAQSLIQKGYFPKSTRTFVFDSGALTNTHFVSIPKGAKNRVAAAVVANFLLSPEAQLKKLRPSEWGDLPIVSLSKLSKKDRKTFLSVPMGKATLPLAKLEASKVSEVSPSTVVEIEKLWKNQVLRR